MKCCTVMVAGSRAWPATPLALSNRLRRAASDLRELGIYADPHKTL